MLLWSSGEGEVLLAIVCWCVGTAALLLMLLVALTVPLHPILSWKIRSLESCSVGRWQVWLYSGIIAEVCGRCLSGAARRGAVGQRDGGSGVLVVASLSTCSPCLCVLWVVQLSEREVLTASKQTPVEAVCG